jgi:hypothetical protein
MENIKNKSSILSDSEYNSLKTGFFTKDNNETIGKVHLVNSFGKPICNSNVTGKFQWCSVTINHEFLSCEKCKAKVKKYNLNKISNLT